MTRATRWTIGLTVGLLTCGTGAPLPEGASAAGPTRGGDVTVRWDAWTDAAVVTIDLDHDTRVDAAWRLQRTGPLADFHGPATLMATATSLAVFPGDGRPVCLAVRGTANAVADAVGCPTIDVAGLAYFPVPPVRDADTLAQVLVDRLCPTTGVRSDGVGCSVCGTGGPGETACAVPETGGCSVSCAEGLYACCNPPDACQCCTSIEASAPQGRGQ